MHLASSQCWRVLFLLLFLTHPLTHPSLACKASCTVIWFICWSSSLTHLNNNPEYLTSGTVKIFLMRFLLQSLLSRSFLIRLRNSFFTYFISICLMVLISYISKNLYFSFSPSIRILFSFGSSVSFITFSTYHHEYSTFFIGQIPLLFCLFQSLQFFFIFSLEIVQCLQLTLDGWFFLVS